MIKGKGLNVLGSLELMSIWCYCSRIPL